MKQKMFTFKLFVVACCFITLGCNTPATETTTPSAEATSSPAKQDQASVKAEIQALENAWAAADNARDAKALAAFYADDAVTAPNNRPIISGKDAILKDLEASIGKRPRGATISYEVMDVFAGDNFATEMGKSTLKDSTGKVTYTGKYMAVWEKRDGKYVCLRDIGNDDVKEQ